MRSTILLIVLSFICSLCSTTLKAQGAPSDFFVLKKGRRTLKNYFQGSYIGFWFENGQWTEGTIVKIAHDSLWMKDQRVELVGRGFGTVIDTVTYGAYRLHIKDIYSMPRVKDNWGFVKNGTLFQLGGAGYIVLNVINGLGKNADPLFGSKNAKKLGIASGVFLIGTLLHYLHPSEMRIGKKYRIQYIPAS